MTAWAFAGTAGVWQGPVQGLRNVPARLLNCGYAGTQGLAGTCPTAPCSARLTNTSHNTRTTACNSTDRRDFRHVKVQKSPCKSLRSCKTTGQSAIEPLRRSLHHSLPVPASLQNPSMRDEVKP